MERVFPFLILMAAGYIMRRIPGVPAHTDRSLNLYVIYIALPALILVQVPRLVFSQDILVPVLMPWLVVLFSAVLVLGICRLLGWPREITGALVLMVPLGNTAFLGIPMVELFFGSSGISYAILYDQFGSFLALATYGTFILALYSGGSMPSAGKIAKKIILFPPFIALVLALLLRPLEYPAWLLNFLKMTSSSLVPVVMVAIGYQLHLKMVPSERAPLLVGLAVRLLITPLFFVMLCRIMGLEGEAVRVSLFETAMPPMVAAGALASIADLRPRLTSALVGYGILTSFATLPLMFRLIG